MKTIELKIPENLEFYENEFSMIIAAKLYQQVRLSAGQAAEMAEVSKRTFLEMLGNYGVSIFPSSTDDLHADIANA